MSVILIYNLLLKLYGMTMQIQTTKLDLEQEQKLAPALNREYIIEQHVYLSKKYFKVVIK